MQIDTEATYDKIIALYEASGMSAARLSEKSGVPLTSINRFLSGETKSPNFYSLCSVILALGGSVDDVLGVHSTAEKTIAPESKYVAQLREDMLYERKAKKVWIILFIAAIMLFIGFLIFDIMNPGIGFIQYSKDIAAYYQEQTAFVIQNL